MIVLYRGAHRHFISACLFAAALGVLGSACKREDTGKEPNTPGETGPGSTVEISRAQEEITQARCDMEQRCGQIGAGKTYTDRDSCLIRVRDAWKTELSFESCSGGIDSKELDQCLTDIRNHECGSVIDALERVVECRSGQLCRS